ncbi:alpha-ketoacid dehydrogenase kinase, N-terminal [Glarea lozoyensis ATCC 20868]|uniref:Protein-serine/threonine kinase n=1 Tax=Glarea lozoyensis (strain ATCC 20868 / MF5171) TaxID=1116229 RepID=S3D6Q5_GLAL2|nr:alpha-ketoacid dehydrogenase kinase, N-terminal [Glarea lozoyensis ATCC 20868]EPE33460.1 alpha-ketoacid dehydrogenase kinase, N-terminal [Glarea lozoyensis ATCC 20868]
MTRRAGRGISLSCEQVRTVHQPPPWRPAYSLDQWVAKEARPISLRQLMVFGRTLTESRLISSANYVRTELPTRLAHRIRDMQTLPYVVVTNPHISQVYELYYKAFEGLRRIPEIKTLDDNQRFCEKVGQNLQEHLTVIPKLAMGVLECRDLMRPEDMDKFMNTILRSRISRRVIAEQHIALTETFHSPHHFPETPLREAEFVGEVLVKCNAQEVVMRCGQEVASLASAAYGPSTLLPEIRLTGHLSATFPYILSHIEYIIGELLRNSLQGLVEKQKSNPGPPTQPPPIEVTVCEAQQHVIIRVSDQGGGIPQDILPHIWSFSKGPRSLSTLQNLNQVPKMAATLQELRPNHPSPLSPPSPSASSLPKSTGTPPTKTGVLMHDSSLASLSSRDPNLRLGMGLPLSRVYAEYWAGSLELHSLEGYGVDAFLQISKLGNKNEQLTMRASMDAV